MNELSSDELDAYYRDAETWSADREQQRARTQRTAWIVAGVAAGIAILEALALVLLVPLRTVVPYTILVDRQTGNVETLDPSARHVVAPDSALVRSYLAQYVIAREGFDIDALQSDYRKVALWSAGDARSRYIALMQATNPQSPLATLPRRSVVSVDVRSISSLGPKSALVRFTTARSDPGAQGQAPQSWVAVISYRFSLAGMSEADRFTNPLGFQVLRYRRNAEVETASPQATPIPLAIPGYSQRGGQP